MIVNIILRLLQTRSVSQPYPVLVYYLGRVLQGKLELAPKQGRPSRSVGGRLKKAREFTGFVLGSRKMSKSPYLSMRILKVYIEVLPWFSHVYGPDVLCNTLVSRPHP